MGISARIVVPRPRRLVISKRPPTASTRSARPCRPEPLPLVRAADAVIADADDERLGLHRHLDLDGACLRVFRDVGERFRHDEVRGCLDRRLEPGGEVDAEIHGCRVPLGESSDGRAQPPLSEDGRMDPSG